MNSFLRKKKMLLLELQGVGHKKNLIACLFTEHASIQCIKPQTESMATHKLSINLFCGIFILNVTLFCCSAPAAAAAIAVGIGSSVQPFTFNGSRTRRVVLNIKNVRVKQLPMNRHMIVSIK